MKKLKVIATIIPLLLGFNAWGKNFYLSQIGAGAKDGTSVANAWQATDTSAQGPLCTGAGCINWGSLGAGDTLYVVGVLHKISSFPIGTNGVENNYFVISGYDANSGIVLGGEQAGWADNDGDGVWTIPFSGTCSGAIEWYTGGDPLTNTKLINAGAFPTAAGSYWYDPANSIVYWKPVGGTITGKAITFNQQSSISIEGKNWVKVTNLKTYLTSYRVGKEYQSNYVWLDRLTIIGAGAGGIAVNGLGTAIGSIYGKITNCIISDAVSVGIGFGAKGNNNNNNYWLIDGNTITDIHSSEDAHAIGIQGGVGNIISNNDLSYANTGITMFSYTSTDQIMNDNIIKNNYIHNMEKARSTGTEGQKRGQGIGWEGTNYRPGRMTGNAVMYNIVANCDGDGIRPKFVDSSNYILNNTVFHCNPNFYFQGVNSSYGVGGIIKNNLSLSPNGYHMIISTFNNGDYSRLTFNNNLYYPDTGNKFHFKGVSYNFANWKTQLNSASVGGYDSNSINSNPVVWNASTTYSSPSDLKLLRSSPAIDKGDNTAWEGKPSVFDFSGLIGVTSDSGTIIAPGGRVDIGAYEKEEGRISPPQNLR